MIEKLESILCDDDFKNKLEEKDFYSTSFVDYELRWMLIDEFMKNSEIIKYSYSHLTYNQKQLYKWYVYANIHIRLAEKDRIWSYLNDDITLNDLKSYEMHYKH